MADKFGFPWEHDAKRAKKSKKAAAKMARYRKSKSTGPKKKLVSKKEVGWYQAYLKSDHWLEFKVKYTESDLPQECIKCGEKKFELHHRTYERIWQEYLSDVVPLCRAHHAKTHKLVKQGHDLWDAHTKLS